MKHIFLLRPFSSPITRVEPCSTGTWQDAYEDTYLRPLYGNRDSDIKGNKNGQQKENIAKCEEKKMSVVSYIISKWLYNFEVSLKIVRINIVRYIHAPWVGNILC